MVAKSISKKMALEMARDTIGGLSEPSKMPWYSYSIPASYCNVGSQLAKLPNTVCSDCYACKGRYLFGTVLDAMQRRYDTLDSDTWVDDFASLLDRLSVGVDSSLLYFRWHDSGDIQSLEHLKRIVAVAIKTPHIRHWLPTRECEVIARYHKEVSSSFPGNLCVRISGVMIDTSNPPRQYGLPVSTVHTDSKLHPDAIGCEAYTRGGRCGGCRLCWDNSVFWVSYPKH